MKKQEKVLAIGDNCVDIYLKEKTFYATGNAVDFAINLKKQGIDVSLITVFSNDIFGEFIKRPYKRTASILAIHTTKMSQLLWQR